MNANYKFIVALTIAAISYPSATRALTVDESGTSTTVEFVSPDGFRDIKNGRISTEKDEARILEEVRKSFIKSASKYLPSEYALEIVVRDIDLAGDQSTLTSTFGDYRVMGDTFPPRIAFDFVVKDANERSVLEGSKSLTDLNYQNNLKTPSMNSDSSAVHVKDLVERWFAGELKKKLRNIN